MTSAERKYLSRIAQLGCFICNRLGYGKTPAQIHHIREGQGTGQKASNWLTIPLCIQHHQDQIDGIHGYRKAWKLAGVDELDGLAWVNEKLAGVA